VTQGCIPVVPSFLRGSTSMLERCGDTEPTNATKAHLILWWAIHGGELGSTKRLSWRRRPKPLDGAWGTHPQLNWRLPRIPRRLKHQRKDYQTTITPRVSKETLGTNSPSKWRGKWNPFGENIDQGLLHQFSEDQYLWMVGEGDLAIWVDLKCLVFLSRTSSLRLKKGRGIYIEWRI
jgi:hypothetical protein